MQNDTHLVIGAGEVGTAIKNVLSEAHDVAIRDVDDDVTGQFDVMHICYPPVENFTEVTKKYAEVYAPRLIIIHSTIPVGTTRAIGENAVHSPVRGVHPNLEEGIKMFVKYFGGDKAEEAAAYFKELGITTKTFPKAETTELAKILDTTYYGWNIVFAKEAKRICDEMGLDFDEVYTAPNTDYNEGYKALGKTNVLRPVLKDIPGKIGGHCVVPNCDLLDDWITRVIRDRNQAYGE